MILITHNTTNTVILTLKEKCTLANPYFLFVFTNDLTRDQVKFNCTDTSLYKDRYNKFSIIETQSMVNHDIGKVKLHPTGYWSYSIYEQTSATNKSVSQTTSLVETGKVKVIGISATLDKYDNSPKNYVAYGIGT